MPFEKTDPNSNPGGRKVTKEDDKATIAALLEERRGYELRGEKGRVAEVDKQLAALGHGAQKRSATAQKRPSSKAPAKR